MEWKVSSETFLSRNLAQTRDWSVYAFPAKDANFPLESPFILCPRGTWHLRIIYDRDVGSQQLRKLVNDVENVSKTWGVHFYFARFHFSARARYFGTPVQRAPSKCSTKTATDLSSGRVPGKHRHFRLSARGCLLEAVGEGRNRRSFAAASIFSSFSNVLLTPVRVLSDAS